MTDIQQAAQSVADAAPQYDAALSRTRSSTVTAAATWAAIIAGAWTGSVAMWIDSVNGRAELAREERAAIRAEPPAVKPTFVARFDTAHATIDSAGVVVHVFRLPGASRLIVEWTAPSGPQDEMPASGLVQSPFADSTEPAGSVVAKRLRAELFGPPWQADQLLELRFRQVVDDPFGRREVAGPQEARKVTVPGP